MSLRFRDLDAQNPLQPPPERGRDARCSGSRRNGPWRPRSTSSSGTRRRPACPSGSDRAPAPLPAGRVFVQHGLHPVVELARDELRVGAIAINAPPADDTGVDGVPEHPVGRAGARRVPQSVPQPLLGSTSLPETESSRLSVTPPLDAAVLQPSAIAVEDPGTRGIARPDTRTCADGSDRLSRSSAAACRIRRGGRRSSSGIGTLHSGSASTRRTLSTSS
jgi:hypothetical protein